MINVYSLCPGGTGKKIKFCCPNRVEDFRKIYKFLEAEQHTACLNHIDRLLKAEPDCSCLLAIRCVVLKFFPARDQELIETASHFYEIHPENPIAVAESAQAILLSGQKAVAEYYNSLPEEARLAVREQEREARRNVLKETVARYQAAFITEHKFLYEQVIFKLEAIAKALIKAELYESAMAWLSLMLNLDISSSFRELFTNIMHQLKTNKAVPLCFREGLKIRHAREGAAWKQTFEETVELALNLHWTQAAAEFKTLAEENPDAQSASELWYNLALISEWLCDIPAAKKYWEKYINCSGVPFYDALEKQIRLSFFSGAPLEDEMEICSLSFPLSETAAVLEKMQSEDSFRQVSDVKLQQTENGTPLAAFDILDAPQSSSLEEIQTEDIPVVVGNAILWEKQGEEAPYLSVINAMRGGADFVEECVRESLNPWITGNSTKKTTRMISVTLDSILRKIALPEGTSQEKFREIRNAHCRSILLNRWIHFPLGILKGLSMKKASKKPEMRMRVETVMYVLYHLLEIEKFDTKMLEDVRTALALAPLPEITPEEAEVLPPIFYALLKPGMLTPKMLKNAFIIERIHGENNIPQDVLISEMNNLEYSPEIRAEIIKALWCMNPESANAFALVEKGKVLCKEANISDVFFDIMEVAHFMNEGKFQSVFEMLKHIRQEHADDRDAAQYVSQLTQYMYGMIQNTTLSDFTTFLQKTASFFPAAENFGEKAMEMQKGNRGFGNALDGDNFQKMWIPD